MKRVAMLAAEQRLAVDHTLQREAKRDSREEPLVGTPAGGASSNDVLCRPTSAARLGALRRPASARRPPSRPPSAHALEALRAAKEGHAQQTEAERFDAAAQGSGTPLVPAGSGTLLPSIFAKRLEKRRELTREELEEERWEAEEENVRAARVSAAADRLEKRAAKRAYDEEVAAAIQRREDEKVESQLRAKRAKASLAAAKRATQLAKKANKKTGDGTESAPADDVVQDNSAENAVPLDEDLHDLAAANPALAAMLGRARRGFEGRSTQQLVSRPTGTARSLWPSRRSRKQGAQETALSSSVSLPAIERR